MRSSRVCKRTWILWLIWQAALSGCWVRCRLGDHSSFVGGGSVVLSFETFFNGRVEKQRQAQRDSWLLFFLFYCCGLAFVSFEHVRFMFNIFWAHFCASRPKAFCSEVAWVCFWHIKRQIKSTLSDLSPICQWSVWISWIWL